MTKAFSLNVQMSFDKSSFHPDLCNFILYSWQGYFVWMYKFLDKSSLHPDLCNFLLYTWQRYFDWMYNFLDKSILHSDLCNFITYLLQRKISIECKKFLDKSSLHPDLCNFKAFVEKVFYLNVQISWQVEFAPRLVLFYNVFVAMSNFI